LDPATDPSPSGPPASGDRHPSSGGEDLYAVLGLEPRASREQVERAYRFCLELYAEGSLATYSLLDPTEAEQQRLRVREAYEVLGDEERRRAYDEAQGFLPPDSPVLPFPAPASAGPEAELPAVLTGADLRKIREARGISLRHIAAVTKIGVRFLEYLEEDRFNFLPAPVYLRGFLQEYARLVGIDPRRAADAYMSRLPAKG
jgi:flagellar biosynthesis protein FlhG